MITIYGTSGCGFCSMAVKKCKEQNLEYQYRDIGYRKWYQEFKSLDVKGFAVPYIIVNNERVGHYKDFVEYLSLNMSRNEMKDNDNRLIDRAVYEDKHHKTFDYKEKNNLCLECGEKEGRHTYKCIYFDRD